MSKNSILRKLIRESIENIVDTVDYDSISESLEALRSNLRKNKALKHVGRDIKENKTRLYATMQLDTVSKLTGIPINELMLFFINKVRTFNEQVLIEMQQHIVYFYDDYQTPDKSNRLDENKIERVVGDNDPVPMPKATVPPKAPKVKDIKVNYITLVDMIPIELMRDDETETPEVNDSAEDFDDHTSMEELEESCGCNHSDEDLQKSANIRLQKSLIVDPVQESHEEEEDDVQSRMNKVLDQIIVGEKPSKVGEV